MSGRDLTIGRWLSDRARRRPTVSRSASSAASSPTPRSSGGDAAGRRARGARPAPRRPAGDAHRHLARSRRDAVRVRPPRRRAPADLVAARARRGGVPARRRRALAPPRLRRARGGRAASGTAVEVARMGDPTLEAEARSRTSPATTTRCSSSTPPAPPGSRRAPSSRTRTASGRTSRSTGRRACATTTSCCRCCRSSTSAAGTSSRCWPGGRARRSCSSRASTRHRAGRDRGAERDDDDGRPSDVPLPRTGPRLRRRRPVEPAPGGRRRRSDAGVAAGEVGRPGRRDRAGLRPHRGRAERAVPAARGRPAQARLRREALSARRRRPARRRVGALLDGPATGELVVRGPNVFSGYWRNPEATEAAFADGWLLTGDVAERDEEGFYRIAGRIKEMVISGGENVYPAEIEDVLHAHAAVLEAAVVGVPDERWGEACAAFVVLRDGGSATEDVLREHCRPARAVQGAEDVRARRLSAARRWARC